MKCFFHEKINFICSRHRVISSMYFVLQKTWQDFVSPPDPRLVEQRRQEFERRKAIEIERRRQKSGG